jgi:hypothetical protein
LSEITAPAFARMKLPTVKLSQYFAASAELTETAAALPPACAPRRLAEFRDVLGYDDRLDQPQADNE